LIIDYNLILSPLIELFVDDFGDFAVLCPTPILDTTRLHQCRDNAVTPDRISKTKFMVGASEPAKTQPPRRVFVGRSKHDIPRSVFMKDIMGISWEYQGIYSIYIYGGPPPVPTLSVPLPVFTVFFAYFGVYIFLTFFRRS
jgi:hypothetical protein